MSNTNRHLLPAAGKLGLLALAILAGQSTLAQDSGWYVGATVGEARAKMDEERITKSLLDGGLVMTGIQKEERQTTYKILGGYQVNRNFAVEGAYFDFGNFGFASSTSPAGTLRGNIRLQGVNLDLVGILPMTDRFSANARIGVNYAEAVDTFSGSGAVRVLNPNPSAKEANMKVGLGLQYALSEAWAVRTDMERYRINDAVGNHGDVDHLSVGLVYRFGTRKPARTYVAPVTYVAPAPAPPPPPPPPLAVATAPPVVTAMPRVQAPPRKVSFSADSLFEFDSAKIKSDDKSELNGLAKDLSTVKFDVIQVTGHTDRIGKHAYNMTLSQQRAEAVRSYLIETAGLPASKITAVGVNGSQPVTTPDQCRGIKPFKALVACLAPDRRVEVEVTGSQ